MTTTTMMMMMMILISLIQLSSAEIKNLEIESDNRPMILFEKFGFTHHGFVQIKVSSVSTSSSSSPPDPSRLGFFLLSEEALIQVLIEIEQTPNFCVLDSHYINPLFTFTDLNSTTLSYQNTYPLTSPNEYSLFFANCAPNSQVSMAVHTEIYNLDDGATKDYLPVGETNLPSLFFFFAVAYLGFLGVWIYVCLANRLSIHRIHLLMSVLILMKALNLICAAEDKHFVKVTGTPHGWDVLFYIFQFIRVTLLFTVIVLIGTGWSFLKPFLQEKEKKVLMIVIPLQVLANVASAVIGETGPFIRDWITWNQVFLLVDVACCFAIIVPILWSIKSLRETSKTDGKAAKNLAKLTLFRQFYIVVIGYLYFTRIVVFALKTISAYKYRWVSNAAEEIVSLAFYLIMFYMFRPVERNEYLVLDDDEEEAAQKILQEEEFEL
ncbi:hypothetical protein Scep_004511 [Stephania cephalantha]|uniref:Uncharacterized protein n=1 Tax=Stephania cephalantha TaxID=152367 RepID=A0AAP0KUD0_9MAGN